jgi:hypothetical protein
LTDPHVEASMDQKNLAELYGLPPIPGSRVVDTLER